MKSLRPAFPLPLDLPLDLLDQVGEHSLNTLSFWLTVPRKQVSMAADSSRKQEFFTLMETGPAAQ